MTEQHDFDRFELITDANPVTGESIPQPDSEVVGRVFGEVTTRIESARRRRQQVQVAGLALVALALIAAGAYWSRSPSQLNGVNCYSAARLDADIFVAPSADGGPGTVNDCVAAWSDGRLVNRSVATPIRASDLIGCVSEDGQLMVFPSSDTGLCNRLGLADAEEPKEVDKGAEVSNALVDFFDLTRCIPMDEAESSVREILKATAEDKPWDLEVGHSTDERPCASYSIDAEKRRIVLVPIPPPPDD